MPIRVKLVLSAGIPLLLIILGMVGFSAVRFPAVVSYRLPGGAIRELADGDELATGAELVPRIRFSGARC